MRPQLLIPYMFFLLPLAITAQNKSSIVENIRKQFRAINSDTSLIKRTLDQEEFMDETTDGGGELIAFFKNKKIVKIVESIGISYGNRIREFYFRDQKLFFAFEKFESFLATDTGLDYSKLKLSYEGRYYFDKEKLVSKITKGKDLVGNKPANEKELISEAKKYLKLLSKRTQ